MLKFIASILLFIFECTIFSTGYEQDIPLFSGKLRAFSEEEIYKRIQERIEQDAMGFVFVAQEISLAEDRDAQKILDEFIVEEGHSFCRRFSCSDAIPCRGVAKKDPEEHEEEDGYKAALRHKLRWTVEENIFYIKKIVCTSEYDDLQEWSLVDENTLFDSPKQPKSWLSSWWSKARTEPTVPEESSQVLVAAQHDQSSQSSYLMTIWRYSKAAVGTLKPAVETFVESKKDADLLDPRTWNWWGNVYELGKIWFVQAAAAGLEAWEGNEEQLKEAKSSIYLDDILAKVSVMLANEGQDLTDTQLSIIQTLVDEAQTELNKFKMRKSEEMNKMLSAVSSVLPANITSEADSAPQISSKDPSSAKRLHEELAKKMSFHLKPPALTIRKASTSSKKVKAAARPTLLDLADDKFLQMRFEFLRQISEFPFAKWPIQKEAMWKRRETVEKRGSSEYEHKLWALAQNVMDDSNGKNSKRTLQYFYAEPGNGKTSGIEEMFTNWLGLPLCKINHGEVSGRSLEKFPTVTGYIKQRILDCLKSFKEKTTGMKIRNGVVLLDDFDRILNGMLADPKAAKDRENFFLFLKDLGDPAQQTIDTTIKYKFSENFEKSMEFPVRISDLYFFITANSIPPEFDEKAQKSEAIKDVINTILSRMTLYQVPYADRKQRIQMLLDAWKPVEKQLNEEAKGKFIIDHELCVQSLETIVNKDGEALDRMHGKMGVRGLVEFFKRFKGTMQTRTLRPDICKLEGNGSEIPFNVEEEAKSIGEYQKEQTKNLRLDAFNKEVAQFLKEFEEELVELNQSEIAIADIETLQNGNNSVESREESLQRLREMIVALNPPDKIEMSKEEREKLGQMVQEQLRYLGDQNLQNIFNIANTILNNLNFGGNQNTRNAAVFLKQDGATDLGIIERLAEILKVPYCRIDGSIENLVTKTPLIWRENQKDKQKGTVYIRVPNGNNIPATWVNAKKIYSANYNSKIYIAGKYISPQMYQAVEVSEIEMSRETSTDSPWIDMCFRQLKKEQRKNLSQVLVLIDRTKEKEGYDAALMDALIESTEGITRRTSGGKIDMRKATIVIAADSEKVNLNHIAALEKLRQEKKVVNVSIHPLTIADRLQFAESYLERCLMDMKKNLNLASIPKPNHVERVALQFISYLDLVAYWQVQEKVGKSIIVDPLREMINILSNKIYERTTAFLRLKNTLNNYTHLFNEWIEKWEFYYGKEFNYPVEIPQVYRSMGNDMFGIDNWQEVVRSWADQDKMMFLEQKRLAEEERRREEERLAKEEEERRREEERRLLEEEERRRENEKLREESQIRKEEKIRENARTLTATAWEKPGFYSQY